MTSGELRRFRTDAFMLPSSLGKYNGEIFVVLNVEPQLFRRYKYVEILILGELNTGWTDKTIMDCSEVIGEAR